MRKGKKFLAVALSLAVTAAYTLAPASAFAASSTVEKEESVYVITDSSGAQSEVIVSDHLKNGANIDKINDKSNLSDIENVKGDEKYEKGTGSSLTWDAKGSDIYYQGTTSREVPVTMNVKYTLDGKEVSGSDLKDKSGDVTIEIKYNNNTSVNGTKVPFLVMSGFMVQDGCLTDITIDNGKVIDDGDKQMVVGLAAPGLAEDLDLSGEDIGLSDSVTIKGKADEFAVDDIMTIVTSSLFEDLDSGKFGDMNFDDEIAALDKGSKALVKGSKTLYEGLETMNDSMPELTEDVDQLTAGAQQLDQGITSLNTQLGQLIASIPGLHQISQGVLDGLNGIKDGLDGTSDKPGAIPTLEQTSEDMIGADGTGGTAADAKAVYDYLTEIAPIINANKEKLAKKDPKYGELANQIDDIKSKAEDVYQHTRQDGGKVDAVADKLQGASDALGGYDVTKQPSEQTSIIGNMAVLYMGMDSMNDSVDDLKAGLGALTTGAKDLADGEEALVSGAQQLAQGMEELQGQTGTLTSGVSKLDNGSLKLSQGMTKLYNQGIKKIVDLYNNDLKGLTSGLESMMDAGKEYKTFTLLPSGMDGSTKFIYKTPVTE
ncbi:MAG: hypothetical protein Q4A65_07190 [Bacillota bacterium]|nr:hypothetical protein [Bacillota bacterium]